MALPIKKQTREQRAVVLRTLELKEQLGYESDSTFAREQLGKISEGRWSKLARDVYDGNVERSITLLQQANNRMEVQLARRHQFDQVSGNISGEYFMLPLFNGIDKAVRKTMTTTGRRRLVFCSLPTGGGKTATCLQLKRKYGALIIHAALPSFRTSSMPLLKELGRALGITVSGKRTKAEEQVIEALKEQDGGILAIDEGNNFGGACADTLKTILNLTQWRVVFFTTPQHFRNFMSWHWDRVDQLLTRSVAIIEMPEIKNTDVRPFLKPFGLNGTLKDACNLLAEAANEFGHFETCDRVVELLTETRNHTLQGVQEAITVNRQRLQSQKMKANGERHAGRGRKK